MNDLLIYLEIFKLENILSISRLIKNEDEAKINKYYYGEEVSLANYKLKQFINRKKVKDYKWSKNK